MGRQLNPLSTSGYSRINFATNPSTVWAHCVLLEKVAQETGNAFENEFLFLGSEAGGFTFTLKCLRTRLLVHLEKNNNPFSSSLFYLISLCIKSLISEARHLLYIFFSIYIYIFLFHSVSMLAKHILPINNREKRKGMVHVVHFQVRTFLPSAPQADDLH